MPSADLLQRIEETKAEIRKLRAAGMHDLADSEEASLRRLEAQR